MMKVSLVLDAIDRASGPIRRITTSIERMGWTAARTTRQVGGSMMFMRDQVIDATHHFRRLAGEDGMLRASRSADYLKRQVSGLTSGLSVLKYAGGAAILGLGEEFTRGVFKVGGEVDQMLKSMERLEGGAGKARASMAWLTSNFALGAGARFSMPSIFKTYQLAMDAGMNPKGGSLVAMSDLAAAYKVPIDRVIFAVKDAMMGTSTRPLANLGIKMHQGKGSDGTNDYAWSDADGTSHHIESSKRPNDILAAIMRVIGTKYSGMAMIQATTLPGALEQSKKALWLFQAAVAGGGSIGGKNGIYGWAIKQLNLFTGWARKAAADGSMQRIAKQISDFMKGAGDKLIKFLRGTKVDDILANLKALGTALVVVAGAIKVIADLGGGGLSGLFNVWLGTKVLGITRALIGLWPVLRAGGTMLRGVIPIVVGFGEAFLGLLAAIDPIVWIIAAIVGLVAAGVFLWRNWSSVTKMLGAIWRGLPSPLVDALSIMLPQIRLFTGFVAMIRAAWAPLVGFFSRLWGSIKKVFTTTVPKLEAMVPSWAKTIGIGMLGVTLGAPGLALGAAIGGSTGAAPAKHAPIGGHMTIEISGDHRAARVTKLKPTNPAFGISVKRGPVIPGG